MDSLRESIEAQMQGRFQRSREPGLLGMNGATTDDLTVAIHFKDVPDLVEAGVMLCAPCLRAPEDPQYRMALTIIDGNAVCILCATERGTDG